MGKYYALLRRICNRLQGFAEKTLGSLQRSIKNLKPSDLDAICKSKRCIEGGNSKRIALKDPDIAWPAT
ncbi:hypothetical protein [Ruegeria atlantica]|uniref:hypothetical protein n=1 Tax=Ruegeria atlantica TaxID=81569 RepID=UPI00071DE76A|nr:hypothetical protein [Ruegeria atlantica]